MAKPSVAIVLGMGGKHKGMPSSGSEDNAETEDETAGLKADAATALKEALAGDDPKAITEAFEAMMSMCGEG